MSDHPPRHRHREVFFAHNGRGPYKCFYCVKRVWFKDVTVHHKNENHDDNRPSNLQAAHFGCHRTWHCEQRVGIKRGPNKKRDYVFTDEHRAAIARGKTGQKLSETAKKKRSEEHTSE